MRFPPGIRTGKTSQNKSPKDAFLPLLTAALPRIITSRSARLACLARRRRPAMFRYLAVPLLLALSSPLAAQDTLLPPADDRPVLQFDPAGPSAAVTALVFSADGDRLYVGGLDK